MGRRDRYLHAIELMKASFTLLRNQRPKGRVLPVACAAKTQAQMACRIDKVRVRKSRDVVQAIGHLGFQRDHLGRDCTAKKTAHRRPIVFHGYGEHGTSAVFGQLASQLEQLWQLNPARRAPGRPEMQEHRAPLQVSQALRRAIGSHHGKSRSGTVDSFDA